LQSYEVPIDFLIEDEPFSSVNELLSGVGKILRPKLKARYGRRLEQMYRDMTSAQVDQIRTLRNTATERPAIDTVTRAAELVLGSGEVPPNARFTDLGGDSLSALTFSNLLTETFATEVPVSVILNPASDLTQLAAYIMERLAADADRATFANVHGANATQIRASDLTLDKFLDTQTIIDAANMAAAMTYERIQHGTEPPIRSSGEPHTVLLTGANGWLGRFLALQWLEQLSERGGKLIALVRGRDEGEAQVRLESVFESGDRTLMSRYRTLAPGHLEILPGDISEPHLGLDSATWARLAHDVDLIVHPAALVNHVLSYKQLFGPNVVGTAELIRLAITARVKRISYLSTIAVASAMEPAVFEEDGDIRLVSAVRPIDDTYANGYANSKWAGEVLLREAHDLCGLPVSVFRSDMIMAHTRYRGQLNLPDMFTRLLLSIVVTGLAPQSFYRTDSAGRRPRAHYDGLPVDFVAEAITTLGTQVTRKFRSFDVVNPHNDGVSLDVIVDWLINDGRTIRRIDDYHEWMTCFEYALAALPDELRQQSILPLLHAYREPLEPIQAASVPSKNFHDAVRAAQVGSDKDIPHLLSSLINKYLSDLQQLGLIEALSR
jgi:fatty acid CoA ligase FadD9